MKRFGIIKKHKLYKNERGATSILIIFMMIVLVMLGTFAITAANVNLKFGKKTISLNRIFYALDSEGERYLYDLDRVLAAAEINAKDYMDAKGYNQPIFRDIPEDLQIIFFNNKKYINDSIDYANETLNKVYLYFANKNIEDLNDVYPNNVVLAFADGNEIFELSTEMNLQSEEDLDTSLEIAVTVTALTFAKEHADRFAVEKWKQVRIPFQYENEPELWDGSIN